MKSLRKHGWLLLLCLCVAPQQLQATSDIELTITLPNGNYIPKGTSAPIEFTLTNHGPEPVNVSPITTNYFMGRSLDLFHTQKTKPCRIYYTDLINSDLKEVLIIAQIFLYQPNGGRVELKAGEHFTCHAGIYVHPKAPNNIEQLFVGYGTPQNPNDPNNENNRKLIKITTSLEPKKVPANNLWALLLLTLMMPLLAFAFKKQRIT